MMDDGFGLFGMVFVGADVGVERGVVGGGEREEGIFDPGVSVVIWRCARRCWNRVNEITLCRCGCFVAVCGAQIVSRVCSDGFAWVGIVEGNFAVVRW